MGYQMNIPANRITSWTRQGIESCEYIGPEGIYWSRGPHIFHSETLEGPLIRIASIPRTALQKILSLSRMGRRLARETFYNIFPVPNGDLFFSYGTEHGFIRNGKVRFLKGAARRHRILRGGAALLPDGSIVFGEYFDNSNREPVRIYRTHSDNDQLEEVYLFAPGEVRHIHSISWDRITSRIIVCTGDLESECRIIAFSENFSKHEVLGQGTEDWRTISPQFSKHAIYYGTDAQFEQNRILRFDRVSKTLSRLANVNGPVFYSFAVNDGWVFGTSAEMCPSQTSPEAILYHLDMQTEAVTELARYSKDIWPTKYFQFGIFNFPILEKYRGHVPISGTALKGLDGRFITLDGQ